MMSAITELINNATQELENTNRDIDTVGNRPHFPMFVASNNMTVDDMRKILMRKMERIWPQTISKVVFSAYSNELGSGVTFKDIDNECELEDVQLQLHLDEIKMTRDTFAEMKLWCIYNIIDTSVISSMDDFKKCFSAIQKMKDAIIDTSRSMLILLLDDSSQKRNLAKEIKSFLADGIPGYDGCFILSNRTQDSVMYKMDDLYKIAANVMILSNNDAVGTYDDSDYNARTSCLYNGNVNTVSYSLLERPNKKIALQLLDTFLCNAKKRIKTEQNNIDLNIRAENLDYDIFMKMFHDLGPK